MSFLNITISYIKIKPIYFESFHFKKRKIIIKSLVSLFLLLGFLYVYFTSNVIALNLKRINLDAVLMETAQKTEAFENAFLDQAMQKDLEFFLSYGLGKPKSIGIIKRFRDVAENKKTLLWE